MGVTPADSRYVPFTQQPYCCTPTCFQMVMYKLGIPLVPVELIGHHMGLIVPPDSAHLFYNVRVSAEKPLAGYGTRIYLPEFEPNEALRKSGIPLRVTQKLISGFGSAAELAKELRRVEAVDADALLCFNQKVLTGDSEKDWGHVVVFDRITNKGIRFVDPSNINPKWRMVDTQVMFEAIVQHGDDKSGGVWLIEKV